MCPAPAPHARPVNTITTPGCINLGGGTRTVKPGGCTSIYIQQHTHAGARKQASVPRPARIDKCVDGYES